MEEFAREQEERPDIAAYEAARHADEGLRRQYRADSLGQKTRLVKAGWVCAQEGDGLGLGCWAHPRQMLQMIHSLFREDDGGIWSHASFKVYQDNRLPSWGQLRDAHWLLYPGLFGVQVLAPQDGHVSINQVLHVWTRLDAPSVPNFGRFGTI